MSSTPESDSDSHIQQSILQIIENTDLTCFDKTIEFNKTLREKIPNKETDISIKTIEFLIKQLKNLYQMSVDEEKQKKEGEGATFEKIILDIENLEIKINCDDEFKAAQYIIQTIHDDLQLCQAKKVSCCFVSTVETCKDKLPITGGGKYTKKSSSHKHKKKKTHRKKKGGETTSSLFPFW